jgi:6-phosphofructokinase 1
VQRGGTILKSARSDEFRTPEGRKKAFDQMQAYGIEGLVAIGGNGTFTGAEMFYNEYGIPTVGAPGTIDNDLYGTDYTIGFDTAVNTALEAIDKIRDTADSHDRIFFIEVMGRDSGYIAVQSGIGGGAELVMVPETASSIEEVIETLKGNVARNKTSSIIIVAEGDEEGGATAVANKVKEYVPKADIKVTNLGHIQRGGSPTAYDRILGSRLGSAAVEGLRQKMLAHQDAVSRRMSQAMLEASQVLSADQRRTLVGLMQEHMHEHGPGHMKHHNADDGMPKS